MSYKLDLSQLRRDSDQSITAQLVDGPAAIEDGRSRLAQSCRRPARSPRRPASTTSRWSAHTSGWQARGSSQPRAAAARSSVRRRRPWPPGDARWQHASCRQRTAATSPRSSRTHGCSRVSDHINLATGWASADLLPIGDLRGSAPRSSPRPAPKHCTYGDPDGLWELRE